MSNFADLKIPHLAIHLIAKYAQIDKVRATENPPLFIEYLVKAYNATKEGGAKKDHVFHKVETPQWNRKEHYDCFLMAYCSRRPNETRPGKFLAALTGSSPEGYQDVNYHFAYFVYFAVNRSKQNHTSNKAQKVWAVFVLTSGQAFRLVRPYCDYAFPTHIAFRVVEPSCLKKEVTPLVGSKEATTSHYKKPYELKMHEYESLWVVFRNFDSHFCQGSSIHPLLGLEEKKEVGVHIGEGMIRIGSALSFDEYLGLLPHFLTIRRGRPTYKNDESLEEDDPSFQVFANIQRVNPKQEKGLNEHLAEVLWKVITQKDFTSTLYLSHRRYREYYRSTEFELRMVYKGADFRVPWSYRPTFHQLVSELQFFYKHHALADFKQQIHLVSMRCNGIDWQFHPLLEFLQGELVLEEDVYFKIGGVWLKVLGQHLATTERAFHQIVKKTLEKTHVQGGHILSDPWISKEEWVSFSKRDLPEGVSATAYDQAMEVLTKHTFCFVDSKGVVKVPYLTRALLRGQDLRMIKSLKKKWDELTDLLKKNGGKVITAETLQELFPDKYQQVFKLLQNPYPVCAPLQSRGGTVTPLGKDGTVQFAALGLVELPKSTPRGISDHLEELTEILKSQDTLTEETLMEVIPRKNSREAAINWLKKGHKLTEAASKRHVFQGPIPSGMVFPDPLRDFFHAKHKEFCLVMDEENYSRLFLGKPHYLVCDQVFPGKRDKIELFDLIYFGDKKKLYLYAIKEGFGTSTGIACTQIRVAAEALAAARRNDGGKEILENLYDVAVSTKASSSFRKKLVEDLKKLSKQEFVDLFRTREIVFVYAFLDTNDEDRRLENELDLNVFVPIGALLKATHQELKSEETLLRDLLIAMGYLDSDFKLKDHFLRSNTDSFKTSFVSFSKRVWKALQNYKDRRSFFRECGLKEKKAKEGLNRVLVQMGYLGPRGITETAQSKTEELFTQELLCFNPEAVHKVLWKMLSQFDSMIAKIELIKLYGDLQKHEFTLQIQQLQRPGPKASRALFNSVDSFSETCSYFEIEKVTLQGKDYYYHKHPKTLEEIFTSLMGVEDLYLARCLLYQMVDKSSEVWLEPACPITEQIAQKAAELSGASLVIHDVNTSKDTVVGESSLLLIKKGLSYFWVDDREIVQASIEGALGEVIGDIGESDLPEEPLGLKNRQNDCFLNALLQLLLRSPLLNSLIEGRKDSPICNAFFSFLLQYVHKKPPLYSYPLRGPLELSETGQEDVQEALIKLLAGFELSNDDLPLVRIDKEVDPLTAKVVLGKHPDDFSSLEVISHTEGLSPTLPLPIPDEENPSFFDCWEGFTTQYSDEKFSYSQGTQVFEVTPSEVQYELQNEPRVLFIHFLRYRWNPATHQIEKMERPVDIPEEIEIGDSTYEVGGWINHHGDTPYVGHYTCHVKDQDQWFSCDDETVLSKGSFESVQASLNQSYIVMLWRKDVM